jgi:hypothetical protein
MDDDDDAPSLGEKPSIDPTKEVRELLRELDGFLKNPDVMSALSDRGVNSSLAIVALDGLNAYLVGDKTQAADDFRTVAEEIEARLKFGNDPPNA